MPRNEKHTTGEQVIATAFMSYTRRDDAYLKGLITKFGDALSGEVRLQLGRDFRIFQDVKDIFTGEDWQKKIETSLDSVFLLLPILTPGYFKSEGCRHELTRFLSRQERLKRDDLILPVYLVNCDEFDEPETAERDPLISAILKHQWRDWRHLRFDEIDSRSSKQELDAFAKNIKQAILNRQISSPDGSASGSGVTSKVQPTASRVGIDLLPIVVDQMGRTGFATISAAIAHAKPGAKILVMPGTYNESILIDKPLEIVGDGRRGEIIVKSLDAAVVRCDTARARISNLRLSQAGSERFNCVDLVRGRLEIECCEISSGGMTGIVARGSSTYLHITESEIHGCASVGISLSEHCEAVITNCTFTDNRGSAIDIFSSADAKITNSKFFRGWTGGIYVHDRGRATVVSNDIFANGLSGIAITTNAEPVIRGNRIFGHVCSDVFVGENGKGTIEENEIRGGCFAGIEVCSGSEPIIRNNKIIESQSGGIYAHDFGKSLVIENNNVSRNAFSGIFLDGPGRAVIRRNHIAGNGQYGICLSNHATADVEYNIFEHNGWVEVACIGEFEQTSQFVGNNPAVGCTFVRLCYPVAEALKDRGISASMSIGIEN